MYETELVIQKVFFRLSSHFFQIEHPVYQCLVIWLDKILLREVLVCFSMQMQVSRNIPYDQFYKFFKTVCNI